LLIPVTDDGWPDCDREFVGVAVALTLDGLTVDAEAPVSPENATLVLVLRGADDAPSVAGLEVYGREELAAGGVRLHTRFGGLGHDLLQPHNLMPRFDPETHRLSLGLHAGVLPAWQAVGVLEPVLLEALRLCPRCLRLPEFVRGCRRCGSTRSGREACYRCVACAFVAPAADFETHAGLTCPFCETEALVPDIGVKIHPGPHRCRGCGAGEPELGLIALCSGCGGRFAEEETRSVRPAAYCARPLVVRAGH
jgi:hypothetical protein